LWRGKERNMKLPIYQVDAFASEVFKGNPAALVPLASWLPDPVMQSIAMENNLSETAFFAREGAGYRLRWFTPKVEVDLCGHATLASAWLILNRLDPGSDSVTFETRSGRLDVKRLGEGEDASLAMDFPARPPVPMDPPRGLTEALGGVRPEAVLVGPTYMAVYESAGHVRGLAPNMAKLATLDKPGTIVTAPGDSGFDFISRYFAPAKGVPEDPVTGSAHCMLTPYWSKRLGKRWLDAYQASARGGVLRCVDNGERVGIEGRCAFYLEGSIRIQA
jgi:PhzF family phenazine biosynthesis protein